MQQGRSRCYLDHEYKNAAQHDHLMTQHKGQVREPLEQEYLHRQRIGFRISHRLASQQK